MKFCGVRHTALAVTQPWEGGQVPHWTGELPETWRELAFQAGQIWQEAGSGLEVLEMAARPSLGAVHEFRPRVHGDGHPFDGRGGTLAHATVGPPGWIHYDAAETWLGPDGDGDGINFLSVGTHEFGHVLGIGHSPDPRAIMYPNYTGQLHLGEWDVAQLDALYPTAPEERPPMPAVFYGRQEHTLFDGQPVPQGTPIVAAMAEDPDTMIAEAEWGDGVWVLRWPMRFGSQVVFWVAGAPAAAEGVVTAATGELVELQLRAHRVAGPDEEKPERVLRLIIEGEIGVRQLPD